MPAVRQQGSTKRKERTTHSKSWMTENIFGKLSSASSGQGEKQKKMEKKSTAQKNCLLYCLSMSSRYRSSHKIGPCPVNSWKLNYKNHWLWLQALAEILSVFSVPGIYQIPLTPAMFRLCPPMQYTEMQALTLLTSTTNDSQTH